jgi:hypothetical protein
MPSPFFLEKLLRPQFSVLQLSEKKDKYSPLRDLNQYGGLVGKIARNIARAAPAVGRLGASGIVFVRCGDTFADAKRRSVLTLRMPPGLRPGSRMGLFFTPSRSGSDGRSPRIRPVMTKSPLYAPSDDTLSPCFRRPPQATPGREMDPCRSASRPQYCWGKIPYLGFEGGEILRPGAFLSIPDWGRGAGGRRTFCQAGFWRRLMGWAMANL